jgi:hypothetical protein
MWKGIGEAEIRARVQAGDWPSPPPARGEITEAFVRICRRALAQEPCARPATALGLADELETALLELPGRAGTRRELGELVARLFAESRQRTRALVEERIGQLQVELTRTTSEISPVNGSLEMPAPSAAPPLRRARGLTAPVIVGLVLAAGALVAWRVARPRTRPPAPSATVAQPAPAVPAAAKRVVAPMVVEPTGRAAAAGPRGESSGSRHPARVTAPAPTAPPPAPDCTHPFFVDGDGIKKFRPECL